jgi:hypothetical protein
MTPRHARRSKIPFPAILILLLIAVVAGVAVLATTGRDSDPTRRVAADGASDPTGGGSATQTTQPSTSATVAAPPPGGAGAFPSATPTPPLRQKIVIHGTGDVSLDPGYIPAFRTNGYGWAWSGLDGLFQDDDLTVINHECPSTDIVDPIPKTFSFRCDPAALEAARRAGIEVANLANNHGFDQGPQGLLDSIRNIRRAGILPVGAGATAAEADAPGYVEVGGWKIGIVGVGEVTDPDYQVAVGNEPGTSVGHDFPRALRAIREADANADLVIVVIHWGVELDNQPRAYQVDEGHRMIDAGADIVFGHHAHRLQPMEVYEGKPIFYGLGNFVWPHFSVDGSTTAVAEAVVRPDGTITGRLLPAYIVSDGHPVLR